MLRSLELYKEFMRFAQGVKVEVNSFCLWELEAMLRNITSSFTPFSTSCQLFWHYFPFNFLFTSCQLFWHYFPFNFLFTSCQLFWHYFPFTIKILISYSSQMGSDTTKSVMTSVVGVMMAATMSIATMAWRRYCRMVERRSTPMTPSNQHTMGSSKTVPIISDMQMNVSIYDCSVRRLFISVLTW